MHRDGRQLVKGGSSQLSAKQLQQRIGTKPCLTDCLDGLMILHEMHRSEYDHLYLFICISWEIQTQDWISSWAFCMWMKYIYVYFYVCWIILEESYYFEFNGNFNFLLGTSLNHLLSTFLFRDIRLINHELLECSKITRTAMLFNIH